MSLLHYLFTWNVQHANIICSDPTLARHSCRLVPVPVPPSKTFKFVLGESTAPKKAHFGVLLTRFLYRLSFPCAAVWLFLAFAGWVIGKLLCCIPGACCSGKLG